MMCIYKNIYMERISMMHTRIFKLSMYKTHTKFHRTQKQLFCMVAHIKSKKKQNSCRTPKTVMTFYDFKCVCCMFLSGRADTVNLNYNTFLRASTPPHSVIYLSAGVRALIKMLMERNEFFAHTTQKRPRKYSIRCGER